MNPDLFAPIPSKLTERFPPGTVVGDALARGKQYAKRVPVDQRSGHVVDGRVTERKSRPCGGDASETE